MDKYSGGYSHNKMYENIISEVSAYEFTLQFLYQKEMNIMELKELAKKCKKYRQSIGKYQQDVAQETGYSVENISAFETGRNDNLRIFLWYIDNGMDISNLRG